MKCDLEKSQFLDGFVTFGGGRYMCPGRSVNTLTLSCGHSDCNCVAYRWLALMEIHLYVAMVIQRFDMQLLDPLPNTVRPHTHTHTHNNYKEKQCIICQRL